MSTATIALLNARIAQQRAMLKDLAEEHRTHTYSCPTIDYDRIEMLFDARRDRIAERIDLLQADLDRLSF